MVRYAAFALSLILSVTANAAEVRGKITDAQTGEPIAGAQIALIETEKKNPEIIALGESGPQGEYSVTGVKAGTYVLSITAPKFTRYQRKDLILAEEAPHLLTVPLRPAQ